MPAHLIEVAFKGNRKEFFHWEGEATPPLKTGVIVEADRGEDLGHVHATGDLAQQRSTGTPQAIPEGTAPRRVLRLATDDDVLRGAELRAQNEVARRRAMERVKANNLVMKLSDAEWQWDRKKLTFYFTAEKRVDFRALVRDLAAMFRTRIELKQIGVRDEARRLDGIGRCGRQYCSASWLPELRPVNLGVAKDQRLSLNPTQISGACGRLMCCLRYEHEFYVQSRKRFPKEGRILVTSAGEEKVVANDIFNDRVTLRNVEGEVRLVALLDLRQELAAAGGDPADAHTADEMRDAIEPGEPGDGRETPEGELSAEGGVRAAPRARREPPRMERSERAERGERAERPDRPDRVGTPAIPGSRPARPPRHEAAPPAGPVTSRPDAWRMLPVIPAPVPVAGIDEARRLEQVAPDLTAADDELAGGPLPARDAMMERGVPAGDTPDDDSDVEAGATDGEGVTRPRRRRGRRGGRRGRGAGATAATGEAAGDLGGDEPAADIVPGTTAADAPPPGTDPSTTD